MALYHNRDKFITLEIKQIWSKRHCRIKKKYWSCHYFCSSLFTVAERCFLECGHFMRSSVFLRCTQDQFQGAGCKLAFAAETQFVGFGKEAGNYRSETQLDSWPCLFHIRAKQSSIQCCVYQMGAPQAQTCCPPSGRGQRGVWEPISLWELKSPWSVAMHGKSHTI